MAQQLREHTAFAEDTGWLTAMSYPSSRGSNASGPHERLHSQVHTHAETYTHLHTVKNNKNRLGWGRDWEEKREGNCSQDLELINFSKLQ